MEPMVIETANLSKRYGKQIVAVDGLNLTIRTGNGLPGGPPNPFAIGFARSRTGAPGDHRTQLQRRYTPAPQTGNVTGKDCRRPSVTSLLTVSSPRKKAS